LAARSGTILERLQGDDGVPEQVAVPGQEEPLPGATEQVGRATEVRGAGRDRGEGALWGARKIRGKGKIWGAGKIG